MSPTCTLAAVVILVSTAPTAFAQDVNTQPATPNAPKSDVSKQQDKTAKTAKPKPQPKPSLSSLVPLNRQKSVLLDVKGRRVLLKSRVCLREGQLEMLICKKQTKEHESILSVDSKAYVIHTALLALGSKTGEPVKFQPEYQPPTGQEVDIYFQWKDADGKLHRDNAQKWVRTNTQRFYVQMLEKLPAEVTLPEDSELKYDAKHKELLWYGVMTAEQRDNLSKLSKDAAFQKMIVEFHRMSQPQQLNAKFVFTGGGFFVDQGTGERTYLPEGGGLVCVANFTSSMIDIAERSSADESRGLLYEAHTEHIPPLDTEVTIELIPVTKKKAADKQK